MSPRPPRGAVRSREAGPSGGSPAPRAAGGRGPGGRWSGPGSPARGAGGGGCGGVCRALADLSARVCETGGRTAGQGAFQLRRCGQHRGVIPGAGD